MLAHLLILLIPSNSEAELYFYVYELNDHGFGRINETCRLARHLMVTRLCINITSVTYGHILVYLFIINYDCFFY